MDMQTTNLFLKLFKLHPMSVDIDEQHCILKSINLLFPWKWSVYDDLEAKQQSGNVIQGAPLLFLACEDLRCKVSTPLVDVLDKIFPPHDLRPRYKIESIR